MFLVTGATGLVGGRLLAELRARGRPALGLARAGADLCCDLTRPAEVAAALARARPEVVVHAAALGDPDACERDPAAAWAQNAEATAHLARAAGAAGAHLVLVSTDYVFSGERGPYAEGEAPQPLGAYGRSKLASELAAQTLAPSWAVARTAVVYGWPAPRRANFGAWLVGELRAGRRVRLFSDQRITPTLASSLAQMLAELAERRLGGVWHLAGAEAVDRVAFGRALCATLGLDPGLIDPVRLAEAGLRAARPLQAGLRVDQAQAELGAKPLPLQEALRRFRQELDLTPSPSP